MFMLSDWLSVIVKNKYLTKVSNSVTPEITAQICVH